MFALRPAKNRKTGASLPSRTFAGLSEGVLPRLLRRPARFLSRLDVDTLEVPRHAMLAATLGVLAATGAYGAVLGGHMPSIVKGVTARSGFAIDDVRISGHRETSEIDILGRLELDGWTSLVGFDADTARARITAMPWVHSASVRKIYPDAIEIEIAEKQPFAIWQRGSDLTLIERDGAEIAPYRSDRYAMLPLVVGAGAAERAQEIVRKLALHPELAGRVKGYVRVADRRWDLRLANGVAVKLPENGEGRAIAELAALDRAHGLLARDIAAVDMRLDDRLVVKLTPEGVVRRDAALSMRAKGKRKGRSI
ncbi:FtsQ-type POTRA domain-containing protein [Nitratireductor sp. CAU 1489]|uniref:Cell division protein FtsQ n=1 Tax=Nitratireductor arenosus TaxID=2682096 RepID=A0A844QGG1_9HYPH|nr:cell division protein FtsQ/DivIB [Nitratireductor arenosus]MVA97148.1 FtsQ-type POTRA domain-containing protein [Nitratireductor arenosus]